jgi:hypothetical protein
MGTVSRGATKLRANKSLTGKAEIKTAIANEGTQTAAPLDQAESPTTRGSP